MRVLGNYFARKPPSDAGRSTGFKYIRINHLKLGSHDPQAIQMVATEIEQILNLN